MGQMAGQAGGGLANRSGFEFLVSTFECPRHGPRGTGHKTRPTHLRFYAPTLPLPAHATSWLSGDARPTRAQKERPARFGRTGLVIPGDDLLSRLRTTIGLDGLSF